MSNKKIYNKCTIERIDCFLVENALGFSGGRGAAGSGISLDFSVHLVSVDIVQNNKAAITNAKLVFSPKRNAKAAITSKFAHLFLSSKQIANSSQILHSLVLFKLLHI